MSEIANAESAIDADWLETYKRQQDVLYWQLVTLDTNIFTLEKIENFPLNVFLPDYDDRIFWQTIKRSLVEAIIICAWRIIVDKDSRALTLIKFREAILDHISNPNIKNDLIVQLAQVDFDKRVSELHRKIDKIRQIHVAHLNREINSGSKKQSLEGFSVSLEELKKLLQITKDLFDGLCFGRLRSLRLDAYQDFHRPESTDIDKILDSVAHNSAILNLPEKEPYLIEEGRYIYEPYELEVVNEYRRKFGKSEIKQNRSDVD